MERLYGDVTRLEAQVWIFKKCPLICLPGDTECAHLPTHTNEPSVHLQIFSTGCFMPHAWLLSCCRAKLKTALN